MWYFIVIYYIYNLICYAIMMYVNVYNIFIWRSTKKNGHEKNKKAKINRFVECCDFDAICHRVYLYWSFYHSTVFTGWFHFGRHVDKFRFFAMRNIYIYAYVDILKCKNEWTMNNYVNCILQRIENNVDCIVHSIMKMAVL